MNQRNKLLVWILLFTLPLFAQSKYVSGKVVDIKSKLPISGATVRISNSSIGTVTNLEGDFSIAVNPRYSNENIEISYIGMIKKEMPISEFKRFETIYLNPEKSKLESQGHSSYQSSNQNNLKLSLPESKYNFSNSKYTELKEYFKGRVIGLNLNYMKISDFLNSEFAGNMINGTIIDDATNFDYSLRLNLIPVFIDVSYFTKSYTYVYWGTSSELKHAGTKFSVSAPFIYVSKLLIPYIGAGYQFSSLKGDVFQNGEVSHSSINTSGTFWKVGIQTYLFKKFPLTVEYNQTFGLNSKNFNQLLLGIGYTY